MYFVFHQGSDDEEGSTWYDEMVRLRDEYRSEAEKELDDGMDWYAQTFMEHEAERTNWSLKKNTDDDRED